jgi:hypothetical protein
MPDKNTDPGFKLNDEPASASASARAASMQLEVAPDARPATDTSTRDIAIGGAIFLVLLVAYFFARNAYVHHLVSRRVAPASAANAGWLMLTGLAMLSGAVIAALVNPDRFLGFATTGSLLVMSVISIVAAVMVGRR